MSKIAIVTDSTSDIPKEKFVKRGGAITSQNPLTGATIEEGKPDGEEGATPKE